MKPYKILSNGEKFRATLARQVLTLFALLVQQYKYWRKRDRFATMPPSTTSRASRTEMYVSIFLVFSYRKGSKLSLAGHLHADVWHWHADVWHWHADVLMCWCVAASTYHGVRCGRSAHSSSCVSSCTLAPVKPVKRVPAALHADRWQRRHASAACADVCWRMLTYANVC
jgi:hypothetical protein